MFLQGQSQNKQQKWEIVFVTSEKAHTSTHTSTHQKTQQKPVYQIMFRVSHHDGPAENPCTWLIQPYPQMLHSWDWQHHLGVKAEEQKRWQRGRQNNIKNNISKSVWWEMEKPKSEVKSPEMPHRQENRNLWEVTEFETI